MAVLLSVRDLTKSFGPRPLFAGLSLDLRAGERVGLIGPNGAGKSTLLRILAGTEPADAGERTIRRGARVGYLAQDDAFPPDRTVREVLLRALADEIIEVSRIYPTGTFRVAGGYDDFADRRDDFLEAQAKQQEAVANQVRRETDWLGHKARARTRKASSRIDAAARRRDE